MPMLGKIHLAHGEQVVGVALVRGKRSMILARPPGLHIGDGGEIHQMLKRQMLRSARRPGAWDDGCERRMKMAAETVAHG